MTSDEMNRRVAHYTSLKPLSFQKDTAQTEEARRVPSEALDLMEFGHSRHLLSVIGLDSGDDTAITRDAPIMGAGGMTMTLAICPPGTGPALHAHLATYETFTVLQGRFELTYNDDGSGALTLERFDVISIPPGVVRTFQNVSDDEGILQVLITGGIHDRADLDFSEIVATKLRELGDEIVPYFQRLGFTFNARDGADQ